MTTAIARASEVLIVDDDPTIHDVLGAALWHSGLRAISFADGPSFLAAADAHRPACVLLDINMPDQSGLDVLRAIDAQKYPAPFLMISGFRDIPIVVEAIKSGATDFVQKPFDAFAVVGRVRDTIAAWMRQRNDRPLPNSFDGHDLLTPREHEVLGQIAGGASNKEIGRNLGISTRTVEVHRARIMEKLIAKNTADLMRIVLGNGRNHLPGNHARPTAPPRPSMTPLFVRR